MCRIDAITQMINETSATQMKTLKSKYIKRLCRVSRYVLAELGFPATCLINAGLSFDFDLKESAFSWYNGYENEINKLAIDVMQSITKATKTRPCTGRSDSPVNIEALKRERALLVRGVLSIASDVNEYLMAQPNQKPINVIVEQIEPLVGHYSVSSVRYKTFTRLLMNTQCHYCR